MRTPRDVLPGARVAGAAAYAVGERYLGLDRHLAGADIVHAAEIGTWFAAQAAGLRQQLGFALALTVWETIAWRRPIAGRASAPIGAASWARPTTSCPPPSARATGSCSRASPPSASRCAHRESTSTTSPRPAARPSHRRRIGSCPPDGSSGRRATRTCCAPSPRCAASWPGRHTPTSSCSSSATGPSARRLQRYARELGVAASVEFRPTVPYDEMPALYASASALVLASLPTRGWEEQFGMVLVEALAARTPVIACSTGAIPEVLGDDGTLVAAGDWLGLAQALGETLAGAPAARAEVDRERLERFSSAAAAERLRAVYAELLEGAGRSPKRPATTSR